MTKKIYNYDEIFQDGEDDTVLMTIPEEICKELNMNPGDDVVITIENNQLIIKRKNG